MDYEEMKLEHLKLIGSVIDRMASNCLRLKEWFVTVVSAIVGFCFTKSEPRLLIVAGGVLLAFWVLDAYYLQQERKFRDLYDAIVESEKEFIPSFSMNVSVVRSNQSYFKALLGSWATFGFYGIVLVIGVVLRCTFERVF